MPLDLDPKRSPAPATVESGARAVCCRSCGAPVAEVDDRIVVGDAALHTFVNPAGLVFRLMCYARADGCAAVGDPSTEWTWFPAHAWQVGICRSCAAHLGWRFSGPQTFWGLIDDRIEVVDDAPAPG